MELILLENIARLGEVGKVVKVKDGYGRNYLIPQGKALRANKTNREAFEARREAYEAQNQQRKLAAVEQAKTLEGVAVTVVRQASDDGKLYGSVSVRDVGDALQAEGYNVDRRLIDLNATIKILGLYNVTVLLHPEVPVTIRVHVARNADSPIPEELVEEAPVAKEAISTEDVAEVSTDASDNTEGASEDDAA